MKTTAVGTLLIITVGLVLMSITGCGDNIQLPSHEQMRLFEEMGPAEPDVNLPQAMVPKLSVEAHCIVPDEVLEVSISAFLGSSVKGQILDRDAITPIVCRVNKIGMITLPVIGEIMAAGLSLSEFEASVIKAYYPKYAKAYPSVFVRLLEPKRYNVSITGAVTTPGIYALRSDQMCLLSLLMEAGGIVEAGAASIRIDRSQALSEVLGQTSKALSGTAIATTRPLSRSVVAWKLTFRQDQSKTTAGWLSAAHGDQTLVRLGLDVACEPDRWALIQRLKAYDAEVNCLAIERQLAILAASLGASGQARLDCISICSAVDSGNLVSPTDFPLLSAERAVATCETTIYQDRASISRQATVILPVKGIDAPFADVALQEGDRVTVKRMVMPIFTVIGLVNRPGNFDYPPGVDYNLVQALGFAGGVDLRLDPRYAVVYRQNPKGQIVHAAFQLFDPKEQGTLAHSAAVAIRPGDIISIEHTPRTRAKEYIEKFVNVNVGGYVPLFD